LVVDFSVIGFWIFMLLDRAFCNHLSWRAFCAVPQEL